MWQWAVRWQLPLWQRLLYELSTLQPCIPTRTDLVHPGFRYLGLVSGSSNLTTVEWHLAVLNYAYIPRFLGYFIRHSYSAGCLLVGMAFGPTTLELSSIWVRVAIFSFMRVPYLYLRVQTLESFQRLGTRAELLKVII
jgi:hypothetical protein